MSKLPKIFHNDLKNNISNNKEYVYVSNNILDNSNFDVDRFITSLSKENGFIFNKPVIIKTKNNTFDTAIIRKNNNLIYTITDDVIDINDIVTIDRKERV